jgi:hypothetical protein
MKRINFSFFSVGLWLKIGILAQGILMIEGNLSLAQSGYRATRRLPAPPSVRQPTRRSDDKGTSICSSCRRPISPAPVSSSPATREYVFQAPYPVRPATVVNSRRPVSSPSNRVAVNRTIEPQQRRVIAANQLFRVQVTGDSSEALTQIKAIEPLAFIRTGEKVIQAGLFQQQQQAKHRVQELASLGFTAHIITLNAQGF